MGDVMGDVARMVHVDRLALAWGPYFAFASLCGRRDVRKNRARLKSRTASVLYREFG